jgi:hypothetical protein
MLKKLFAAAAVAVTAPAVFAAGEAPDYSSLTSSLDFSTVATGAMAIGAAVIGMYAAIKGVKIVIGMVKGA